PRNGPGDRPGGRRPAVAAHACGSDGPSLAKAYVPRPGSAAARVARQARGGAWRPLPLAGLERPAARMDAPPHPPPTAPAPHSPLGGLVPALAGMLAGTLVLRAVRFVFTTGRGMEGMGMGDADLMMMAGAFIGWQPVIAAFFVSVVPGLLFGITRLLVRGKQD